MFLTRSLKLEVRKKQSAPATLVRFELLTFND